MPFPSVAGRLYDSNENSAMKKLIAAALLLSGPIWGQIYALDLTPHEILLSNDGPPLKRYFFQDGDKRLSFRIDNKMTINGASNSVTFGFNDIKGAGMKLSKSQMNPEIPFDQKNLESYRSAARTFLPRDAMNIQLDEEKPNAIAINSWTSHQFIFSYNLFGFPYRCSVTFLNYSEKEQIIFEVDASATDFEKTYMRGYRVLNSISDLSPGSESGPT
jgi:hypothetical protein